MTHPFNSVLDLANCSYIWASICIFAKFSLINDHSSVPMLYICISFVVVNFSFICTCICRCICACICACIWACIFSLMIPDIGEGALGAAGSEHTLATPTVHHLEVPGTMDSGGYWCTFVRVDGFWWMCVHIVGYWWIFVHSYFFTTFHQWISYLL